MLHFADPSQLHAPRPTHRRLFADFAIEQDLRQVDLARMFDVPPSTMRRWINGGHPSPQIDDCILRFPTWPPDVRDSFKALLVPPPFDGKMIPLAHEITRRGCEAQFIVLSLAGRGTSIGAVDELQKILEAITRASIDLQSAAAHFLAAGRRRKP